MSRQLINEYRSELDRIIKVGGTLNEGTVRSAFQSLLKAWGKSHDLTFIPEHKMTGSGGNIWVDGALVYDIRVAFGYWEAKDSKDDLEEEIRKKEAKGYPKTNIIYEDTQTAILIQDGKRAGQADMSDTEALYALLTRFYAYEQAAIRDFRKAIEKFAEDLPAILERLRERIRDKREDSADFRKAEEDFLAQVKQTINPALERADVTEMLIQHILTADIFNRVFDMTDYHRQNNIGAQLQKLDEKLFEYGDRRSLLAALRPYYTGIEDTAHLIQSHSEKQNFLKSLYENFYKVYNPKAADRLGVVYTPGEIVRFMIRSADWLCEKHFGKNLVDQGVEILDPATGTGTYIVELLEYFRGQPDKLRQKYKEELHANEVAVLPYYVANLNIEATYQVITGQFAEFEGLCLVDTLDNVDGLGIHQGHQFDLLGGLSDENIERVKRQNRRKISVIIGNPPYNANQQNENDNNKNREYPHIDDRIKRTYIKESTAQKTKLYDMYSRFYRWASDRLGDEGIIAFITNRSFIESRTFDGFRKVVGGSFDAIWIVDLGGDYKEPSEAGAANVFGIGTGVAIAFLVRTKAKNWEKLRLTVSPDVGAEDKLSWLGNIRAETVHARLVAHPEKGEWTGIELQSTAGMIPLVDKKTKTKFEKRYERSIFKLFSLGVATNRDEWVYDLSRERLESKVNFFIDEFNEHHSRWRSEGRPTPINDWVKRNIKWTSELEKRLTIAETLEFNSENLRPSLYRPFAKIESYFATSISHRPYQQDNFFPFGVSKGTAYMAMTGPSAQKPWMAIAGDCLPDLHLVGSGAGSNVLPRYRYTSEGERIDNITDWALNKFTKHYGKRAKITKDAIFAYCYAVLHDPVYREKYALNLKREFPRIPFYPDFAMWTEWGETLLNLHIDYEDQEPWDIDRVDTPNPKRAKGSPPKPKLKSEPENGVVVVDEDTQITGIPRGAWDYRLGNRSAIDWVLDQHKEKKPRDPTIREKFNTYRFADYKESMITLLSKVVRVSVETNAITDAMKALDREGWEET